MTFADYCLKDEEWKRLKAIEDEAEREWNNPPECGPCSGEIGEELLSTGSFGAWQNAKADRVIYQGRLRFKWRSYIGCVCYVGPGNKCIHDSMAKGPA